MMTKLTEYPLLIESDDFPFEELSLIAEHESWRKEVHRPIYYLHKWWAKRLGSVFRGILLGAVLNEKQDLIEEFYKNHIFTEKTVFDPFMGSGVTIGEAHKLGFIALGRDINPVAFNTVKAALGPINERKVREEFKRISESVGKRISELYLTTDSQGHEAEVLYFFWVMLISCPRCQNSIDLFSNRVIAGHAYPKIHPETKVLCPQCGNIFSSTHGSTSAKCTECGITFNPSDGPVNRSTVSCSKCENNFQIIDAINISGGKPDFRLYGKLILKENGEKEYLRVSETDLQKYKESTDLLKRELMEAKVSIPDLKLEEGYNTKQAINYGFKKWKDFYNERQLLALGWLQREISKIIDKDTRDLFLILFSGILEFNNMFTSYKGEGTGAVRPLFYHHILKPERTPIEANVWGTSKSSGSFYTLYNSRLENLLKYRNNPKEVLLKESEKLKIETSNSFLGKVELDWPTNGVYLPGEIYLSCGSSSDTRLMEKSIDLIVTDPPFFDNVNYSELADFFYSWQQLYSSDEHFGLSTRNKLEVQDMDRLRFSTKLTAVFKECSRVLKDEGLMVFTYHQSNSDGWSALLSALRDSNFKVVNAHPIKAEMSVAAPKSQTQDPIQLDSIIICRKSNKIEHGDLPLEELRQRTINKISRLEGAGFKLSKNDRRVILYGQTLSYVQNIDELEYVIENPILYSTL